jgi:hypothetical protein
VPQPFTPSGAPRSYQIPAGTDPNDVVQWFKDVVTSIEAYFALAATLTGTETLTNKSLTEPNIDGMHSWGGLFEYPTFTAPTEAVTISGTGATGTINLDALDKSVILITASATANWTINLRGNASWSLDSVMNGGDSMTFVVLATQGATAYYPTAIKVDGTTVTVKWAGGVAPTFGNANGIDAYALTVIKTATATFTVLGSVGRYA